MPTLSRTPHPSPRGRPSAACRAGLAVGALVPALLSAQQAATTPAASAKRPMTFVDMQYTRQVGGVAVSPDGRMALYTVSAPDWKEARSQSDVYVVDIARGVKSGRQLTYTRDKNETSPRWAKDGSFFVFASNRDAPAAQGQQQQLYLMRPDGGEGRRITDAKDGVSNFQFSPDGQWLVFRSGKTDEEQLNALPVAALSAGTPLDSLKATPLTKHPTGVGLWRWSPDAKRIYFVTADTVDRDEKLRTEKRFTATVRNAEQAASSLWSFDPATKKTTRLTRDTSYSVTTFSISDDGRWIGFTGVANNRYKRNITEQGIYGDQYLLDTQGNAIERLTNNAEGAESPVSFSPDSRWIAFSASDDMTAYNMKNGRVYLRAVGDKGGQWRKLGTGLDGDVSVGWWSKDGRTIYFNEGWRATNQLFALDVASGAVKQLTNEQAVVSVDQDEDSKRLLISYADPTTPNTIYTVGSIDQVARRAAWTQLTDANPQLRGVALGEESEVTWTSKDGKQVAACSIKPVGYEPGRRYPLLVAIHGGPAAADRWASTAATVPRSTRARARSCSCRTTAARPTTARRTRTASSATTSIRATRTS